MPNPVVLLASSRPEGHTKKAVQGALEFCLGESVKDVSWEILCTLSILPYDYENKNATDDFLSLIRRLLQHDLIIFATPVYWYTMSAHMKIFFDRITDLLVHHKELLRAFKDKKAMIIASSASGKPEAFEIPFALTFQYLSMDYIGCWDFIFPEKTPEHVAHNQEQKKSLEGQWKKCMPF
jgi:multimeric flavodoxin WrbA